MKSTDDPVRGNSVCKKYSKYLLQVNKEINLIKVGRAPKFLMVLIDFITEELEVRIYGARWGP